jgi:hypothetical protein
MPVGRSRKFATTISSAAPPGHRVELKQPEYGRFLASWWMSNDGEGSRVDLRELVRCGCRGFGQGGRTMRNFCGRWSWVPCGGGWGKFWINGR